MLWVASKHLPWLSTNCSYEDFTRNSVLYIWQVFFCFVLFYLLYIWMFSAMAPSNFLCHPGVPKSLSSQHYQHLFLLYHRDRSHLVWILSLSPFVKSMEQVLLAEASCPSILRTLSPFYVIPLWFCPTIIFNLLLFWFHAISYLDFNKRLQSRVWEHYLRLVGWLEPWYTGWHCVGLIIPSAFI